MNRTEQNSLKNQTKNRTEVKKYIPHIPKYTRLSFTERTSIFRWSKSKQTNKQSVRDK